LIPIDCSCSVHFFQIYKLKDQFYVHFHQYPFFDKNQKQYPDAEKRFFSRSQWFDLLMGTSQVRKDILQGKTESEIRQAWEKDLQAYRSFREKYLLFE
jgi:uncharacterized protein YbbC (DUF1343 family)